MRRGTITLGIVALILSATLVCAQTATQEPQILPAEQISKVVPPGFYFEGQLAPTQMRNAAAVRFGGTHHFIAALVDTSGYSSSIRSKYEGFLIVDAPVTLGGVTLKPGAYGFGFTDDGKLNILDVGGNVLQTAAAKKDEQAKSPRPLVLSKSGNELRLYRGRMFATLALK